MKIFIKKLLLVRLFLHAFNDSSYFRISLKGIVTVLPVQLQKRKETDDKQISQGHIAGK